MIAVFNRPDFMKAQAFIKMNSRLIRSHYSVKLEPAKPLFPCVLQAMAHHFPPDSLSAAVLPNRIGSIGNMAAPSEIIGMQDINANHLSIERSANSRGLLPEHLQSFFFRKGFIAREADSLLHDVVPYFRHLGQLFLCEFLHY